jgi:hypothetical protein
MVLVGGNRLRVLVCGSRHFNDYNKLKEVLNGLTIDEIIHGGARGADTLAGQYGENNSIPVRVFPALWDLHGKRAGPIRNTQMLTEGTPDYIVAFLAKDSKGTKNMIEQATKAGIPVEVVHIE